MSNNIRINNLRCQGIALFKLLELIEIKHHLKNNRRVSLQVWEQRTYMNEQNNTSFMIDEEWDYYIDIDNYVITIACETQILCDDNQKENIMKWLNMYGLGLVY